MTNPPSPATHRPSSQRFLFPFLFLILYSLFLLITPKLSAQTQNTVSATSAPAQQALKTFTLDETLSALRLDAGLRSDAGLRPAAKSGETANFRWDPFLQSGAFSLGDHNGVFTAAAAAGETGFLLLDGREVFTVLLPYRQGGALVFPENFVKTLQGAFTRSFEDDASRFRIAAIIIDPGHGGKDPGAIGNPEVNSKPVRAVEKDIVLNVSKALNTQLSRAFPDKRVLMTRDRDVFYSLEERVAIANSVSLNENEAIIYISIHANYVFNQNVRGYEVWYLSPNYRRNVLDRSRYNDSADIIAIRNAMLEEEFTTESVILAQSILRSLGQTLGNTVPSRGIKAEEWFVVRNSHMPAVLVELGFVSNPQDAQMMTTEGGLQKLTEALYKGIIEFVSVFERSGGFTAAP
ncbi:N-acetylmuramoyl-L-alanine amidase [Spirochaetia bacterium]|nr:N-acetylmuramoyl-L-alanine amidase [Spirochaetia bacterium]